MLKKYRFGFDVQGLLLFIVIMIPNFIWFDLPAPNDILRADSATEAFWYNSLRLPGADGYSPLYFDKQRTKEIEHYAVDCRSCRLLSAVFCKLDFLLYRHNEYCSYTGINAPALFSIFIFRHRQKEHNSGCSDFAFYNLSLDIRNCQLYYLTAFDRSWL